MMTLQTTFITVLVGLMTSAVARSQCEQILSVEGLDPGARYGWALDLQGDFALVGSYKDDVEAPDAGAAYVFHRNRGVWKMQAVLFGGGEIESNRFGVAVDLDGDRAIVGAEGAPPRAAYVFLRTGDVWTREAMLTPPGDDHSFGTSVQLLGDTAFVGAFSDVDDHLAGAVYVFQRNETDWSFVQRLEPINGKKGDRFGRALGGHGDLIVVGAPDNSDFASEAGSAYVFQRQGDDWVQTQQLFDKHPNAGDRFGSRVATDGHWILSNINDGELGEEAGSVLVFEPDGEFWTLATKLVASDGHPTHLFGEAIAIQDGVIAATALLDGDAGENAGAVYLFEETGGEWVETKKLVSESAQAGSVLGWETALDGGTVLLSSQGGLPHFNGVVAFGPGSGDVSTYCTTTRNSQGSGALIGHEGSLSISSNAFTLVTTDGVPGQFGAYCYAPEQGRTPLGDGFLCISPGNAGIFRLVPANLFDSGGSLAHWVDFTGAPADSGPGQILSGQTWNFQLWYRDPAGPGGTGSNLSNALSVIFCP